MIREIYTDRDRDAEKQRNGETLLVIGEKKVEKGGKGENEKTRLFLSSFLSPEMRIREKKEKVFSLKKMGKMSFSVVIRQMGKQTKI